MTAATEPIRYRRATSVAQAEPEAPDTDWSSGPPAGEPDRFCVALSRIAALVLDAPVALVTALEGSVRVVRGAVDRDGAEIPRYLPAISQYSPGAERNPAPNGPGLPVGGVVTHLEIPVCAVSGAVLGTLCVADRRDRRWTDGERARLSELGELLREQWAGSVAVDGHNDMRALSRQLADDIAGAADSVHSLAEIADRHEDPRLHRFAAMSRKRLAGALSTAESLREATGTDTLERPAARRFDLRQAVNRALREAAFVSGRGNVEADLGEAAVPVAGDQFGAERAITHLVTTAMQHSVTANARVSLTHNGSGDERAALTVTAAAGSRLSAAEITRIVARFDEAGGIAPGQVRSSVRLAGGELIVSSAAVTVRSNDAYTTFAAHWPIDRG